MFRQPFEWRKRIDTNQPEAARALREIDTIVNNTEEQYHAEIEGTSVGLLAMLEAGDMSFLDDSKKAMHYCYYMALQYLRTKRVQEAVVAKLTNSNESLPFDPRRCWNVLRHLFAMRFGANLFVTRSDYRLIFLENATSTPFITGDQPIINTYSAANDPLEDHHLEFYYPLSPTRAMLWTDKHKDSNWSPHKPVDETEVSQYNLIVRKMSHEMIFCNRETTLQEIVAEKC